MQKRRTDQRIVTLMLQDAKGCPWRITLSADCELFIGHYPRLPEFRTLNGWLTYL